MNMIRQDWEYLGEELISLVARWVEMQSGTSESGGAVTGDKPIEPSQPDLKHAYPIRQIASCMISAKEVLFLIQYITVVFQAVEVEHGGLPLELRKA